MSSTVTPLKHETLVIVGNGMVGHHCIEQLIEQDALARYDVHVFGEERQRAYDRVHLSEYFGGRDAESLAMCEADYYSRHGVQAHLGEQVLEIDRERKEVVTGNGRQPYDKLILATGSYPSCRRFPVPKATRGWSTAPSRISTASARPQPAHAAVWWSAEACSAWKRPTPSSPRPEAHVVEFAPRLMPVQLDDAGGAALKARIEALGVGVHLSRATQEIIVGEQYAYRMVFQDGEFLETDLIVFSAGIRPQDALARDCGLELAARGGVVVDSDCRTSDPAIFAIGECASWNGSVFGLVAPGYSMARCVAAQLADAAHTPFSVQTCQPNSSCSAWMSAPSVTPMARPRAAGATVSSTRPAPATAAWSSPPMASACWARCW